MRNLLNFMTICFISIVILSGCASNVNKMISKRLDTELMHSKLETKKSDLSSDSKCSDEKNLKVINGELRTDKYCIDEFMGCRMFIIPKDFTNDIVTYIEKRLTESNLKIGSSSDIIVSLEELKSQEGVWTFGSSCKIKVNIPEINYTQTYVGESGSPLGDYAAAYAIHLAVENFLKDPVFQNYLKCQQSAMAPKTEWLAKRKLTDGRWSQTLNSE